MATQPRISNAMLSLMAETAVAFAFCCSMVSATDYRVLLLLALIGVVVAICSATVMFIRGGWVRWVGVAVAALASYVAFSSLLRVSSTFG